MRRSADIGLVYNLGYDLFVTAGNKPAERAGAEHQHDRRSAGLELVHQPHRRAAADA